MKKITCVLFFVFFWLQYSFWFGKHGVFDFFRIKNNANITMINNRKVELKIHNYRLISDINDFINIQEEVVEEYARSDLELIKSDEVFYRIVTVNKK